MDLRKIKKLIELVEESGIAELEVRDGEEAIRIVRPSGGAIPMATHSPSALPAGVRMGGGEVTAPMAGTFFVASAPGVDPFVKLGDPVAVGQVVGIIESMKMMNEITADTAGICVAIDVANGQAVGSGQILLRLE